MRWGASISGDDFFAGGTQGMSVYYRKPWSTFFGPWWDDVKTKMPRGMYGQEGKLLKAATLLGSGISNRDVSRRTGMHRDTVGRLRKILETTKGRLVLCACGKPSNHRGWCSKRLTPKRREFLKRWHIKQSTEEPK